jgi:hypothetical protein
MLARRIATIDIAGGIDKWDLAQENTPTKLQRVGVNCRKAGRGDGFRQSRVIHRIAFMFTRAANTHW